MEFFAAIPGLNLFFDFLLKSSLILCCALFLSYLFRKQSAALRHMLLALSLIGLLFLPYLSSIDGWEASFLPAWSLTPGHSSPIEGASAQTGSIDTVTKGQPLTSSTIQRISAGKADAVGPGLWAPAEPLNRLGRYVLFIVWLLVILLLFSRIISGLLGARQLNIESAPVTGPRWRRLLSVCLKAITLKRKIRLLSNNRLQAPITWGVFKPVVCLPANYSNWNSDQSMATLYHELFHIKRGDFIIQLLARVACALFWFNPLSWITFKALKREQEMACDEMVLQTGIKPSTYASALLWVKRHQQPADPFPAAALGLARQAQLNERVLTILKNNFNLKEIKMKSRILLITVIFTCVSLIGLARSPQSSSSSPEENDNSNNSALSSQTDAAQVTASSSQEQEKKQIKEKKTDKTEKKTDKKIIYIYISEDGKKKTFTISDGHLAIVKDGKKLLFKGKGKEFLVDGAKAVQLKVEGDKLTIIKDGKLSDVLKSDHLSFRKVEKDDGNFELVITSKDGKKKTIHITAPLILKLNKHAGGKADVKTIAIHLDESLKKSKPYKKVDLHLSKELKKGKKIKTAPYISVHTAENLHRHEKELENQLEEINETLARIEEEKLDSLETMAEYQQYVANLKNKKIKKNLEKIMEQMNRELREKTEQRDESLKKLEESLKKMAEKLKEEKKMNLTWSIKADKLTVKHEKDDVKYEKADTFHRVYTVKEDQMTARQEISVSDSGLILKYVSAKKLSKEQLAGYSNTIKEFEKKLPEGYSIKSELTTKKQVITIHTTKNDQGSYSSSLKKIDQLKDLFEDLLKELNELDSDGAFQN